MKLEEAEKIVEHCSNEHNGCDDCIADGECGGGPWMYIEAMEVVIANRDARIAELEEGLKRQKNMHTRFVWEAAREMSDSVSMAKSVQDNFTRVQSERDDARKDAVDIAGNLMFTLETIYQLEKSRTVLSDNSIYKKCIKLLERYR